MSRHILIIIYVYNSIIYVIYPPYIYIHIHTHSNEYKLVFVKQRIKIAFFLYLPCFFLFSASRKFNYLWNLGHFCLLCLFINMDMFIYKYVYLHFIYEFLLHTYVYTYMCVCPTHVHSAQGIKNRE